MGLSEILRHRREELGLTQDRVAAQVGISKPYLSNIETGRAKNPPTDGVLVLLEATLKFDTGELLKLAHLARTPADVRNEHELLEAEVNKLRGVIKKMLTKSHPDKSGGINLDDLSDELTGSENVRGISAGVLVPIINKVAAGYPAHFTDMDYPPSVADDYIRCPDVHDSQAFAARVVGDSMEPAYHEGDIVVFSPGTPPECGDDCFVRFDDYGGTTFKRFYQDKGNKIRLQPLNSRYPAETYAPDTITGLWPAVYKIEPLRRR